MSDKSLFSADEWRAIKGKLHAVFVRHMGAEVVNARSLRWNS